MSKNKQHRYPKCRGAELIPAPRATTIDVPSAWPLYGVMILSPFRLSGSPPHLSSTYNVLRYDVAPCFISKLLTHHLHKLMIALVRNIYVLVV